MLREMLGVVGLVVVMVGAPGALHAADTILGLPAPQDPNRPGTLLLHGGGPLSSEVCARFLELAGGKQARIVLVPSAGFRRSDYTTGQQYTDALNRRFGSWLRLGANGWVKSVEILSTDAPRDCENAAFVRPLTTATGVWFSGGIQSRLNYLYVGNSFPRPSRFQVALRGVLERGGVVGGTSAGMAALPEVMTMDQGRSRVEEPMRIVAAHGLGLFDGAIVEQHFDSRGGRLERFVGLLRDSARLDRLAGRRGAGPRMLGLAVETSTALLVQSDQLQALGTGEAHVLIKSPDDRTITWHALKAGDKRTLQRDPRGNVVLHSVPPGN
jgi:cyanophycinase